MKTKIIIWALVTVLLFSLVSASSIEETVNTYYDSFANEDFGTYWNTQYLLPYSSEELKLKQDGILETWKVIDTLSYTLKNLVVEENADLGLASYTVNVVLGEIVNGEPKTLGYTMDMTAILINDNGWKIISVNPTELVKTNLDYEILKENVTFINKTPVLPPKIVDTKVKDDFKKVKFVARCGDGICEEDEDCIYDCKGNLEINLPPIADKPSECVPDITEFTNIKDFSLDKIQGASTLIGNDKIIEFSFDKETFYYHVLDGLVNRVNETKPDYIITTDACTIEKIMDGANAQLEYDTGNIKLKGNSAGSKIKVGVGKLLFNIYSWFKKPPLEIWVEAESGELIGKGKYSSLGPSSRGPGEAYLGNGGVSVKYIVNSKKNAEVYFYISITDDALHKDGSRDATFTVNGKEIKFKHISKNTVTKDSPWAWQLLGKTNLKKGKNIITVTKDKSTSAAFVMDKFVLSENKMDFS